MKVFFLIIPFLAMFTCNTPKNTANTDHTTDANSTTSEKIIYFEKGGCYGTCPIYNLTLYSDGKAIYEGIRFSDRLGKHTKMLPAKTIQALMTQCAQTDLRALPDEYPSRIPDLPSSRLTYFYENGATKKIFWREQADDALLAIGKQIEAIAKDNTEWTLLPDQDLPAGAIPNQLIVNLQEDTDLNAFLKSYVMYDMVSQERIHPKRNYWLVAYNTDAIAPYEMLGLVVKDERVLSAEFNKEVNQRN